MKLQKNDTEEPLQIGNTGIIKQKTDKRNKKMTKTKTKKTKKKTKEKKKKKRRLGGRMQMKKQV